NGGWRTLNAKYQTAVSGLMKTRLGYFVPISFRRSAGTWSKIQSAWLLATCVTSASTERPNFLTIASGRPSGCASFDHSLKYVFRTTFISLFGEYSVHLDGPVPAGGMLTLWGGVEAGRMNANGTASLSRNSESPCVRWKVTVLPLTTIPFDRSHVFGVLMHASAPTIPLYQVPAFGLSPILNSRSNVALTSLPVSA